VVALSFYLGLFMLLFFYESAPAFDGGIGWGSKAVLISSGAFVFAFIVAASPIITAADAAAKALLS
jgi:hypothetical protein